MRSLLTLLFAGVFIILQAQNTEKNFAIAIHGGAGWILKEKMSAEEIKQHEEKLKEAVNAGYAVLEKGGSSLDAVTKAIIILEDSPLFNAGKGAVFTHEESNELDASIMDGKSLKAGAVAGINRVKNPIMAARAVMEISEHVMLSGKGAEAFAESVGLELVDPEYFKTPDRLKSLQELKQKEANKKDQGYVPNEIWPDYKYGTVGAVALDKNGSLAAATSTGGMTNKRYGRIGDAPIIAAGTYADNNTCAVSCTGHGEYFIRKVVAYDVSAKMKYAKKTLLEAAGEAIEETRILGGKGGLIAIDQKGNIATPFSTPGMYRAWKKSSGEEQIKMFAD
ncbi:MAG: isoaspartyl peptidase/L-asparaginase family protein [Luteibaculum sp.]